MMRRMALLCMLALLAGCTTSDVIEPMGAASSASISTRVALAYPRFDDNKPHEWQAKKPIHYAVHGTDVSKYQRSIDWHTAKRSGISFAFVKATEGGDRVDDYFDEHWSSTRAAGVPRGAYHFVYWCRPWQEEMAWFKSNVPREPDALPPVLDVEATPESRTCKRTIVPEQAIPEMRLMLQEMERHYGKRPVIYTTVDFYEAILADGALTEYPIWVRSTKHRPHVRYGSRKWHFWQYQSDGAVPGIVGKVDRNVFHGSPAEWQKWLASN